MRETVNTMDGNSDLPSPTGLPAAYSPGTAATDNLIAMMTDHFIVLDPPLKFVDSPSAQPAHPSTTDGEKPLKIQRVVVRD